MKRLTIGLALLLVAGCVTESPRELEPTTSRPSWMENPSLKYPAKYFLTAVGEGDTLREAQDAAIAGLAKIFKSDINVEERMDERYYEMIGEKNSYQEKTDFSRNVRVQSNISLLNVAYAQSYRDKTGRVYALAYIDRRSTAEIYIKRLKKNDERIVQFVEQSKAGSPEVRYAALSAALSVSRGSTLLQDQLDVILPSARQLVKMSYSTDTIGRMYSEAASAIRFAVKVQGDIDGKVATAVTSMLTSMGFTVADNGALRVAGHVLFQDTDLKRGDIIFVRYEVKLDVIDVAGQTVVGVFSRGREGHVSRQEARARCLRTVSKLVDSELRERLQAYFDGLIKK